MFEGKEVKVILAQAGSGKTHKLLNIVSDELKTRRPEELAFVTFTRKGAEEGLRRACNNFMYSPEDLPYFRTLHSLTFHALELTFEQMMNRKHEVIFNRKYGYSLNRSIVSATLHPTQDSRYLDYYDLERSSALTTLMLVEADIELGYYRQLVKHYEEYKQENKLVDFFDCLLHYLQYGEPLPCKVVLVDECQDITSLQWKVIEKAFSNAEKFYFVGDENQSIYTYSGARPDFLIDFSKKFPTDYLVESYRIPKSVYDFSKGIVQYVVDKTNKPFEFHESNGYGSITQLNNVLRLKNYIKEPVEDKTTTDWYLLARNKCFLSRYQDMLEDALIPYWTSDGFFIAVKELNLITEYENYRLKGFGSKEKKEKFKTKYLITAFNASWTESNLFSDKRKWVLYSYVEKYGIEKLKEMIKWNPQILVATIHCVKGGEAENVSILLDTTRKTAGSIYRNVDEELRVLYVGVTRTKSNLFLVDSESKDGWDKIITTIKEENGLVW